MAASFLEELSSFLNGYVSTDTVFEVLTEVNQLIGRERYLNIVTMSGELTGPPLLTFLLDVEHSPVFRQWVENRLRVLVPCFIVLKKGSDLWHMWREDTLAEELECTG